MRSARIDQYPELKDTLAQLLADGKPRQEIADAMGVSDRGTVSEWAKRTEIQNRVTRLIQERANKILSKTDVKILARLDADEQIPTDILLRIRQTFAAEKLEVSVSSSQEEVLQRLTEALHENPELAEQLGLTE